MHEITLRRARPGDVPDIMAIMTAAHEAMADPSAYLTDSEDYVSAHISRDGFVLLAQAEGRAAGFLLVCVPGAGENNLGHYLGFDCSRLLDTAMMDSVAVDPAFQGHGLMERMLRAAVAETEGDYGNLLATVAPGNWKSLRTFEKCGFRRLRLVVKPQGPERWLLGRFREGLA